jgi:hypothetical protein
MFHPKSTPKPCSGVISLKLTMQSSPLHVGGVGHNRATGSSSRLNHKQKSWKVRESKPSCVLGKDIAMDRVASLSKKALVGKFFIPG